MSSMPSFPASASVCASALNKLLRREPWASDRLARHSGKTVRFVVGPWVIGLSVQSDGRVQPSSPAVVPDVTLTIPKERLGQLPRVLRSGDSSAIAEIMRVDGDAGLASVVSDLARELRWDVEDDLARLVGDVAAVRLLDGVRRLTGAARQAGDRLAGNVGEYLTEESRMLLARTAFVEWQTRLGIMQQRLAALEHSVAGLEQQAAARAGHRDSSC
ncbi:MAG: hypothetical protein EPN76_02815 [Burkholderiaceae bacterium]|nr:MAG: hypothetical protein EPN76_02815 [Burkholderiaceae bacterium]TAM01466.1 MAG: hypothetical protein EPN67_12875 [Pusillimonas sp.]